MGLPELPPRHVAHHSRPPGHGRAVEAVRARAIGDEGDEGEEGWLDATRRAICRRDRRAGARVDRRGAVLDFDRAAADCRRHPDPGPQPRRARLADRRAAVSPRACRSRGSTGCSCSKPLAVRDLLAAVTFAVQPLDDLNLANLLVSPLIGWDQEQLFDLAYGREGRAVACASRAGRASATISRPRTRSLGELLAMADFTTPSRFLETILSGPLDGRRKLYSPARPGGARPDRRADDRRARVRAQRNRRRSSASIAWFARGDVEIERDPVRARECGAGDDRARRQGPGSAVRDPCRRDRRPGEARPAQSAARLAGRRREGPRSSARARRSWSRRSRASSRRAGARPRGALAAALRRDDPRQRAAGRRGASKPKRRQSRKTAGTGSVERALASLGAVPMRTQRWGSVAALSRQIPAESAQGREGSRPPASPPCPIGRAAPAPAEARPPRPLAPSALAEDDEAAPPPSDAMRAAARRGTLIHQLLERLPAVGTDRRAGSGRSLARAVGRAWRTPARAGEIADQVCGVLSDPRFAALFGPGSLGEAPLAATLPDGRVIAGTVDRLLIEERRVSVIDFKTGRVPASDSGHPGGASRADGGLFRGAARHLPGRRDARRAALHRRPDAHRSHALRAARASAHMPVNL